jgi:8-amino-7-oxononanoate synthase
VSGAWGAWASAEGERIRERGRWRVVRDFDSDGAVGGRLGDGREVVSFAGNDYLGLRVHPAVVSAARAALDRWGTGAGAARLLTGSRPVHGELEAALAGWKRAERALLFPTGYMANLGVLSALGGAGTRLLSDERNHASIIDGCRLARAEVAVYPHGDADAVARLLGRAGARAVVVTDAVFSMDGDLAPLEELAWLCRRHQALLVVDEAHSALGPEPDLGGAEVLRVGTLSKTLGAVGGFVAGPGPLVDLLRNRARPFIFTTAAPPADAAAALAALAVLRSEEGLALLRRLRGHVERLAPGHPSPILPVQLGDERAALGAAAELERAGLLVPAIRPPTVPPGSSRLRVSLSAAHTTAQVEALAGALARLGLGSPARPRAAAGRGGIRG